MIKKQCHECHGKKIVKGMEEMTVFIEKGMNHGHEIVQILFTLSNLMI